MTAPASLIERLPSWFRQRALTRLSKNANAPGAATKTAVGTRAPNNAFRKRAAEVGILLIESRVTGALAADVGCVNPPNVATVSLDTGGGTPASTDITTSELDSVTWAGAGAQLVTVTAPAGLSGATTVTV